MAAAALGNELLAITEDEAATLAKAGAKVARHYPMKASAQAMDWVGFIMALGSVYGTRVFAARMMKDHSAEKPASNWTPSVVN